MVMSQRAGWALLLGGVGLSILGGYVIYQRRYVLPLGRVVHRLAEQAPVVGETNEGGMKLQHRRSGNMSIEQRVSSIQDLVWKSVQLPSMRKLALGITNKCPERDETCEAKAVYDAVRARIRYNGDVAPVKMPNGAVEPIDMFHRADRTWEFGAADCDDQSILVATLLSLNGIPSRLRVTAEKKSADWGHIYCVAGLSKMNPTRWLALDTTLPGKNNFAKEMPFGKHLDFPV